LGDEGEPMKKLYFLLIDVYLLIAALLSTVYLDDVMDQGTKFLLWAGSSILFGVIAIVLIVINIISAIRIRKKLPGDEALQQKLNRSILLYKLLLIPMYVRIFIIGCTMLILATRTPTFILMLILIVLAEYLLLVVSALYAISLIKTKHGEGIFRKAPAIHYILQFIFVLDVIDYIILYPRLRKPAPLCST
jgi:magnesium-transporting ATPase (P-type)